jgi:hypothetical protein
MTTGHLDRQLIRTGTGRLVADGVHSVVVIGQVQFGGRSRSFALFANETLVQH